MPPDAVWLVVETFGQLEWAIDSVHSTEEAAKRRASELRGGATEVTVERWDVDSSGT